MLTSFAQHHGHTHRNLHHHTKIVADKHYAQDTSASKFSAEVFWGNVNTWTGDNYGLDLSVQALLTYDNNKNTSFGVFGAFNRRGLDGGSSDGSDIFFSRKVNKKFSVILDDYAYFNRRDTLESTLGYSARMYTLSTVRFQYDLNKHISAIAGYSVFNNTDSLQQFVSLELDYNLTDELTLLAVYSTGTHLLKTSEGTFTSGLGFTGSIKMFNVGMIFSPFIEQAFIKNNSLCMIYISTDLAEWTRKFKHSDNNKR